MIDASVAVDLEEPAWTNNDGQVCNIKESFRLKVTHDIVHPDYFTVANKSGGNII